MREWCGGGIARWLGTGYGIDGFGPGRWLVSLGNRQIVKSTANADWQQKAGSWSAQRGGVERTGVGRGRGRGSKEVSQKQSVARVRQPDFQSQAQLDSRVYIIGCASSTRLDPNLVSCDMGTRSATRALSTSIPLCPYLRFRIVFALMGCNGSSRPPHSTRPGTPVDSETPKWRLSRQLHVRLSEHR
jgi:hypothetical protein